MKCCSCNGLTGTVAICKSITAELSEHLSAQQRTQKQVRIQRYTKIQLKIAGR
jgi:hypothetical protein